MRAGGVIWILWKGWCIVMRDVDLLRLDRWLSLAVVAPVRRVFSREARGTIPILMYHSIDEDVDCKMHPYFRTVTSPRRFSEQVKFLRREGYQAISISQAIDLLSRSGGAGACDERRVIITFDDGFLNVYTKAFPVLEQVGFSATVFLATDYVGRKFVNGRPCLSEPQIREMSKAGIEFGSHSVTHRRLVTLPLDELEREIRDSKKIIEEIIDREVSSFSFPYRFPEENKRFTGVLREQLEAAGYRIGVTTAIGRPGVTDDPLFLPRLPVNDCDDTKLFNAKLLGNYDWLHAGQLLHKRSHAWIQNWRGL